MADAGEYKKRDQTPRRPRWKSQKVNARHVQWLATRQVASLIDSAVVNYTKVCVVRYGSGRNVKDKSDCRSGTSGCGDDIVWRLDVAIGLISDRKL
jgi:hypothetical protein